MNTDRIYKAIHLLDTLDDGTQPHQEGYNILNEALRQQEITEEVERVLAALEC